MTKNKQVLTIIVIGAISLAAFLFSKVVDYFVPEESTSKMSRQTNPNKQQAPVIKDPDMQETRKMTEQFAKSYVTYNAKKPYAYLEQIKPLVTPLFFKIYSEKPRDISEGALSRTMESLKVFEGESSTNSISWNAIVIEVTTLPQNESLKEEKSYWLTINKQTDGSWKIDQLQVTSDDVE